MDDYDAFRREWREGKHKELEKNPTPEYLERKQRHNQESIRRHFEEMTKKSLDKFAKIREADRIRYGGMEMGYDSGTGSESEQEQVEERRVRAMKQRKIEEPAVQKVAHQVEDATEMMRQMAIGKGGIDKSDKFSGGLNEVPRQVQEYSGLKGTGMSQHLQYGEKHKFAKLTDETAQAIRKEYWGGGGNRKTAGGGKKVAGSQQQLADKYGVSREAIRYVLNRSSWIHLPQVEGEPDENMNKTSMNERKTLKLAKELGVEPIRNKIGRLALPEEVVLKLRKEATERREATKKAKAEKKKAEGK